MPSPELITHFPARAAGMEPLEALASAPSLTALATCAALLWLVYRAWLVMVIKEDDLIKLLGLDVPAAPQVSLAGIKADGAVFHWEPAEPRSSIQAYQIKINGVFVEEVGPKDTSVNVANLKPGTAYTLRVIAINHHNFHTQSEPLRFRTKPPSSDDFFDFAAYNRAVEIANDDEHEHDEKWWVEPKITPCKGFLEPTSPLPTPSDMVRSQSNSTSHPRRATTGRRNSPNTSAYQQADDSADDTKSGETEAQLQAEGDKLRSDIAVTRKAIDEEEKGFKDQKDVFSAKHNELKDELARKTAASSELRKEVVNLEKENQRAQAKKTAEEKSLDKKLSERKKMQDDVQRFRAEMDEMAGEIERFGQKQVEYQQSSEQKAQELRDKHSEELGVIKALEDSVRETGIQNRILEEERKKYEGGEGDIDAELRAQWAEEERQWSDRIRGLQQRYQTAWATLQAAERAYNEAQSQLHILSQRAANQPQVFRQPPILDAAPSRRASQRRRPHAGSVGQDSFSAAPSFSVTTAPYNNNSISNISPSVMSSSPFFNYANGAVPISNRESSFSPAEIEMLTGGAPMSPNAGALLPSDLFAGETDRSADEGESDFRPDLDEDRHSSGSFGRGPDALAIPGLGAHQARETANRSPSSPASAQSRSPSLFASPRASSNQLPIGYPSQDSGKEADALSVKSLSGSARHVGGSMLQSRFGQLFSRQRGKTLSDEGPALGSLKPSQSHSMPRQDPAELDPIGTQRRRGSHSGGSSWMDSMAKPFRSSTGPSTVSPSHVQTRKRGFKLFPGKEDESSWPAAFGMERPPSPRPNSTKSFGDVNQLPRPSTESSQRFGWGPAEPPAQRSSPLNTTVELGYNAMSGYSRHPSRRPSIQYGNSSTGLGYEDIVEDNYDYGPVMRSQAPIGTRPPSQPQQQPQPAPATPPSGKLNPAAPVFKGLWDRSADKNSIPKSESFDATAEEARPSATAATDFATSVSSTVPTVEPPESPSDVLANLDVSPISMRKSRDGRASTVTSNAETASLSLSASWSPRASLDRSESRNTSESLAGTSVGKESWMSKLSRKGSSSKFQLPGFGSISGGSSKDKGSSASSFFSRSPRVDRDHNNDEHDDDSAAGTEPPTPGFVSSFANSASSSPYIGGGDGRERSKEEKKADRSSGLSWSSLRRKKKSSEKAPSINESIASEREGDERDEGAEGLGVSGA
ncbi:fibronectin type iii domain protein [Diplodia corticola]|uniref:Fibronectin type iii domain protein n=1 Tax=Diplodia corticola TaxID=236234 RepID=A0A1J9S6Y3_9PEZI|nr:fibronectin type iii domain protein [Diplodia corticola]OJD35365.1 fibronectin type iii domain protein [Diplodia corticola]